MFIGYLKVKEHLLFHVIFFYDIDRIIINLLSLKGYHENE